MNPPDVQEETRAFMEVILKESCQVEQHVRRLEGEPMAVNAAKELQKHAEKLSTTYNELKALLQCPDDLDFQLLTEFKEELKPGMVWYADVGRGVAKSLSAQLVSKKKKKPESEAGAADFGTKGGEQ